MDTLEQQMLANIFAPSLQYLRLSCVSAGITWSWFDSGNGSDIWFSKLLKLRVDFDRFEPPSFSDQKRVHFPVLKKLKVNDYPYYDGRFSKLSEGCPLKKVDITLPDAADYHIPPQLLAGLHDMNIHIARKYLRVERNKGQQISKRSAYEQIIAKLVSIPSTVVSAELQGYYFSETVSLPDTIAWASIRKLDLGFNIDMKSIYAVLAQIPKLRQLKFSMLAEYLEGLYEEGASLYSEADEGLRVISNSLLCLSISGDHRYTKPMVQYLLLNILPLVPSLLKLVVYENILEHAKDAVADLAGSLERIPQQLEVERGICQ